MSRKSPTSGRLALATVALLSMLVAACGGGGGGSGAGNPSAPPSGATYTVSGGVAQKGPLLLGSTVTAQELNASLSPTGKQYSYQTTSDFGTFTPNSAFTSQYLGISASGYYFDEVANAISGGPITLSGYVDISSVAVVNVNLLTTLAYQRTQHLVGQSGLTFSAAERQAQREVLAVFGILDRGNLGSFNTWDLSKGRDADHMLAALSSIFVYGNTSGNLSSLIAKFQNDLAADGVINDAAIRTTLLASARAVNPAVVASNLSQKYASAGVTFDPTSIGAWIDQDGDGVVARFKFRVPDATQASSFTLPSFAVAALAGLQVHVSAGQLSINGTAVSVPTEIASGDVVAIAAPAGGFPDGALTTYLSTGTTRLASVTFVRGLVSMAVTPSTASLQVSSVQAFTATGAFTDGGTADLTASVTWSSSEPTVAAINAATGAAQGLMVGTTTISATSGSISGSTTLSVVPAALTAIQVTPTSLGTGIGIARQFRAMATYADGSTADVTSTATWTASVPSVATVTGGMATGAALGPTDIVATVGSIEGSATLNVTTNTWSPAANLSSRRVNHVATLLQNGKVLVTGGQADSSVTLKRADLYDPVTDTWSSVPDMPDVHRSHTATVLPNGKVLVAGGMSSIIGWSWFVDLYDPSTNSWSTAADMPDQRSEHTATLLPDGRVLIVGGQLTGTYTAKASIYDPATNTWSAAASMASPHSHHTSTLLPNGTVLVAGGYGSTVLASAEVYDPATNTWTAAANMLTARASHTATVLPGGTVLVVGGSTSGSTTLASAEIYDPATNTWAAVSSMATPRTDHGIALLPTGKVLVAGGSNGAAGLASAEIYDPATNTWAAAASMAQARSGRRTTVVSAAGLVMVVSGNNFPSSELYW